MFSVQYTARRPAIAAALAAAWIALPAAPAMADEESVDLDPVTIVGSPEAARAVTGGATVVTEEELEKHEFTDIQRILRLVPGVSVQVEDGFGLRPNISIRGTASDRSSRITLLEDGILIAPAPYSAPAAYFFPTSGRLSGVEVLKGPASILEGPYTTGGAINLISRRIPASASGQVTAEAGTDGHLRGHAFYGASNEHGGFVVEGHEWRHDGFQSIDRSTRNTGLDKSDYLARVALNLPGTGGDHRLELKARYADETSNQTYFGLTDADFQEDPYRRYGVSELDQMNNEHRQLVLSYSGRVSDRLRIRAAAYNNDYERAWRKSDGVDLDGSNGWQDFDGANWFSLIQAINRGENFQGFTPEELQALLDGTADSAPGAIELRNNSREYYSRGVQGEARMDLETGGIGHDLRIGARLHEDEEDRIQRFDTFTQVNGALVPEDDGVAGNRGNRIEQAEAWALWIYDSIDFGRLTVSPGVRYENIELKRTRYEDRVGQTDDPASRDPSNLRDTRENDLDIWLPGVGLRYALSGELSAIAGVHRGFSAPSSDPDSRPERSTNYEAGLRYNDGRTYAEAIAFWNEYSNLVGVCTLSSGTGCEVGDVFSGDAARVKGLEFTFGRDLSNSARFSLPFNLVYTYTDGEFRSDLADSNFFGDVEAGDPIPYLPDHELFVSLGLEVADWAINASVNHVDSVCAFASCGEFERTDSATIVDLAAEYDLTRDVQVYALARNLFEEDGIAGRQPRGARPNLDRAFIGGVRVRF